MLLQKKCFYQLTGTSDIAIFARSAGFTTPILVVDLEKSVIDGAIFIHFAHFTRCAAALVFNQADPWKHHI